MRILLRVAACVALLWVGVSGSSGVQVLFGEGANTKGEVPTYVSQLVQDWIAESLRRARPGSRLTSVKDAGAQLGFRRQAELLRGGNGDAVLNIARALGAKTVETVDVVQNGEQLSVTVSRLDQDGRSQARSEIVVSMTDWPAAFDKLVAFAKQLAKQTAEAMPEMSTAETYAQTYGGDGNEAAQEQVKDEHAEARSTEYAAAASSASAGTGGRK